ncbi:Glutamine--fructose-6-phosphate transaminase (isomerizing) [Sulfobacillus acidophilus TPY]|uniref:Sugar isomerase (SIS) n=1 Tax=Sulfobacillus acidophilus (strain ATCC 700253 / DSM 10332 / NAL) TaxID=679936 RepID=G8TTM4_SULAD|nr:Glutamine--fructose-6-phosphate transaminase (isomerizing) [Sulfobacillus acidophilus TPY]AEW05690.1 sugar isomerase (SIS) [Sulfobacillus acidophilus DSM 10332]
MPQGAKVLELIGNQPRTWASYEHSEPLLGKAPYLFTGSGSSYYLAQVAAAICQRLGIAAHAVPAGDIMMEPRVVLAGYATVVTISRSGQTTEAVTAARTAKQSGLTVVAATCREDGEVTTFADQILLADHADDQTVVMIRSFTSMLYQLQRALESALGLSPSLTRTVVDHAASVIARSDALKQDYLMSPPRRTYILGSGVRYGIAQEGALKMQEMAGTSALAFHTLEFRHGPWGPLSAQDMVVLLGQESLASYEASLYRDLTRRTDRIAIIASQRWYEEAQVNPTNISVVLPDNRDLWCGPLAIIPLQMAAWAWTISLGLDPDHPQNLNAVVVLDRD